MSQEAKTIEINEVLTQLSKKENAEALLSLIDKLPEITSVVKSVEELSIFTRETLKDKQSIGPIFDEAEKKIEDLELNEQTLQSLSELTKLIPRVVFLLQNTLEGIQFINGVLKDEESMEFIRKEFEPFTEKARGAVAIFKETNKRCSDDPSIPNVSIFKLVSLLKDENIRKGYKYLQTFLTVIAEKK